MILNFKKEGITTETQIKINNQISNMVNNGKEDAVIIYFLHDKYGYTLPEARTELAKAKAWMGWYALA